MIEFLERTLFRKIDGASIALFRIILGLFLLWEAIIFINNEWHLGFTDNPYIYFTYEYFQWVKPFSANGMKVLFLIFTLSSLFFLLGFLYRISAIVLFSTFTYIFLLDQSNYLNHFYLLSLLTFLMIFIPGNRCFSVDNLLFGYKGNLVSNWSILILRFQIGIVYFYGGVAKLNYDWLVLSQPMKYWIISRDSFPIIGSFFKYEATAFVMSWSGMLLDLLAPFLLLNRRTRPWMFLVLFCFHLMNDRLFSIGIFPYVMLCATTIFFPIDWFRNYIDFLKSVLFRKEGLVHMILVVSITSLFTFIHGKFEILPFSTVLIMSSVLIWVFKNKGLIGDTKSNYDEITNYKTIKYPITLFLSIWCFVQLSVPLRHFFIPSNVAFTGEGYRFSWHMKLSDKAGVIDFFLFNKHTNEFVAIDYKKFLLPRQEMKMKTRPFMILQFAKFLGMHYKIDPNGPLEIRAQSFVALNFRKYQRLIDHNTNLLNLNYSDWKRNYWILDLDENISPEPNFEIGASKNNEVM